MKQEKEVFDMDDEEYAAFLMTLVVRPEILDHKDIYQLGEGFEYFYSDKEYKNA